MKGGVVTKISPEPIDVQFQQIIQQSKLTPLSYGSYGYTLYVETTIDTGFLNYETGEPVQHFILKIVPLDVFMTYKENALPIDPEKYTRKTTVEKFMEEPDMLHDCYQKSLQKHHFAICPAMLLSSIYKIDQLDALIPDVYSYATGEDVPTTPLPIEEYSKYRVGILFMECAPGVTISKYLKDHPEELNAIKHKSIRLYCIAIDCGIEHDDPNKANIMIDDRGNLTLIDFGYARKLSVPNHHLYNALIAKSVATKNYTELIQLLSRRKWKMVNGERKMFQSYQWFYEDSPHHPFIMAESVNHPLPITTVRDCLSGICTPTDTDIPDTPDPWIDTPIELNEEAEAYFERKRQPLLAIKSQLHEGKLKVHDALRLLRVTTIPKLPEDELLHGTNLFIDLLIKKEHNSAERKLLLSQIVKQHEIEKGHVKKRKAGSRKRKAGSRKRLK